MAGAMYVTCLNDLSWKELEPMVPRRQVHTDDNILPPDESDSEDKEEVKGCIELFDRLWDTSSICPASTKGQTKIHTLSTHSTDEQLKLTTAADIWKVGQRCRFVPYRTWCWNPDGVPGYSPRERFMRHMCAIHCLIMQEWVCTTGSCKITFDRMSECVTHGTKLPPF